MICVYINNLYTRSQAARTEVQRQKLQQNLPLLKHAFQGVGNEHPIATPIKAYQNTQPRHVVKGDRAGPLFPLMDHWHASDVVLFSFSFPFLFSHCVFGFSCLLSRFLQVKMSRSKVLHENTRPKNLLNEAGLAGPVPTGTPPSRRISKAKVCWARLVNASGHGSCWSALWELCWFRKRSNALVGHRMILQCFCLSLMPSNIALMQRP